MAEGLTLNLGGGGRPVPDDVVVGRVINVDLSSCGDIKADLRDIPLPENHADVAYASHVLEHFDEHEIDGVLKEWRRVLKPGGRLVIEVPDIQAAAERIATDGVDAFMYVARNGAEIRAQDMLYGWQVDIRRGGELMRHKVGFDMKKLGAALQRAGFAGTVNRYTGVFALFADVRKPAEAPLRPSTGPTNDAAAK